MTRSYAQFSTSMWRDPDYVALPFALKYMYKLLCTQADISAAGVLSLNLTRWAGRSPDTTVADIEAWLDALAVQRFVVLDRQTEEVFVRSFLRWDNGYKNPKRQHSIRDAADAIESPAIVSALAAEFARVGMPEKLRGQCSEDRIPADLAEPREDPPDSAFSQVEWPSMANAENQEGLSRSERRVPHTSTHTPHTTTREAGALVAELAPPVAEAPPPPAVVNNIEPKEINTPIVPAQRWLDGDRKPTTPTAIHGRTAALFPKPRPVAVETLPEAHQVIYRWLQDNGFATLGIDEVRHIHRQLITRYGTKLNMNYLRSIVTADVALPYAVELKQARNKAINDTIVEMGAVFPQCLHGTPAGDQPHPTTGALLCRQCRNGEPAVEVEASTNPTVTAAVLAYRAAHGVDMPTGETILVAQQAEAFLAEGAAAEVVVQLAARAGAASQTLIQAAQQGAS